MSNAAVDRRLAKLEGSLSIGSCPAPAREVNARAPTGAGDLT